MGDFFGILAAPLGTLQRIKNQPHWFLPMLLCIATFFMIIWIGGCWRNLSEALTLSSVLGPALISPLIVGIVSVGTTLFLYLMIVVVGAGTRGRLGFKSIYSLNIHCAAIILLGEVINFFLVRANILGESRFPLPNRFPLGLDLVLLVTDEASVYTAILLHSTSCFIVWYLVVLANGITIITGSSRSKSILVVATLWCVSVAMVLGLAYAAGGGTTIRIRM